MQKCLYDIHMGSLLNVILWPCVGMDFNLQPLVFPLKQNFNNYFMALLHIINNSQANSFPIKVLAFLLWLYPS